MIAERHSPVVVILLYSHNVRTTTAWDAAADPDLKPWNKGLS